MTGLAKQLFTERQNGSPWKEKQKKAHEPAWPTIQKLLDERYFLYIDFSLAQLLLKNCHANEETALFLCYLSLAVRSGHLCVKIEGDKLHPQPETLFRKSSHETTNSSLNPEDFEALLASLQAALCAGAHIMPKELISIDPEPATTTKPLHRCRNTYYFQKYWLQETSFITDFKRITSSNPLLQSDISRIEQQIEELCHNNSLLPEQAEAIRMAAAQNLTIISGGPGTGKTYTAGLLIKLLLKSLSPEARAQCNIALAAPTGKAAANLQNSLLRALTGESDALDCNAKTIHSLLGLNKRGRSNTKQSIKAQIILIDECSMIDAHLMSKLFAAIPSGAKLILLGDPYQLPPVESGLVFGDLIKYGRSNGSTTSVELVKCLRAELQPIIDLAESVKQGKNGLFLQMLSDENAGKGIQRLENAYTDSYEMQKYFLHLALEALPHPDPSKQSHGDILSSFNKFKILSPMRKGPLGFETLNLLIAKHMQRAAGKSGPFIAPILITKNDYSLDLCNGETGILIKQDSSCERVQEGDMALFSEGDSIRSIPALLLPPYEYAYCMSIHKSQGSEFDKVIVLLPEGSESFGREVLYTAVTRAKKELLLWGSDETLTKVIAARAERHSGIADRLSTH